MGGIKDHDYCVEAFDISQVDPEAAAEAAAAAATPAAPPPPKVEEELSEMDKILSDVAMGSANLEVTASPKSEQASPPGSKKKKKKKDKKKKKKKEREQKVKDQRKLCPIFIWRSSSSLVV